jgi:3-phosphoshikimate 1-carboxyvinyltransferase
MKIRIEPAGPVSLDVTVPGSKSLTNRALAAAALARGTSRLTNASLSDDSRLLARGLDRLGIPVELLESRDRIVVRGRGGEIPAASGRFNMGNAGTALRFFASILCLGRGNYVLDGDARMRERPIGGLVAALRALGAEIAYGAREGYPPLRIRARGLQGGRASVSGETSSQFVSSLLLSAPAAEGEVLIDVVGEAVSKPYIDLTIDVMRRMGVKVGREGYRSFRVAAGSAYRAGETAVESDGASANYFLAMAAVTGGRARVRGVGSASIQGEARFREVLREMGCAVRTGKDWIEVRGGALRGVDVDLNDMPDSVQTLACAALFAKGRTRVRNVRNLRVKETDRLRALAVELGKLGARVEEREDGLTIHPPAKVRPAGIETYKDHRMAMSFSVAAAASPGIVIRDPACVSKSFPGFFGVLESQGLRVVRLRG